MVVVSGRDQGQRVDSKAALQAGCQVLFGVSRAGGVLLGGALGLPGGMSTVSGKSGVTVASGR